MGSDNHCNLLFITKNMKILPKIAPCARIESSCGFVEQQYGGMMKQALSQFQPPLHSSRKRDRKSTRLNSSHEWISYAVFCLKKKKKKKKKHKQIKNEI